MAIRASYPRIEPRERLIPFLKGAGRDRYKKRPSRKIRTRNIAAARASRGPEPVLRVVEPDEIANACVWLCSDASGYVTRQTIGVNGGRIVNYAWLCPLMG